MKKELFEELLRSVKQGGAILRGEMKPSRTFKFGQPDVRSIRDHYGLSQPKFADMLGISVSTLRNWEQGRRKPEGAAQILLLVAAKYPKTVLEVVHQSSKSVVKKSGRAYAAR
jgi:putative transcriptional regulator